MQDLETNAGNLCRSDIAYIIPHAPQGCFEIFQCSHGGNGLRATRVSFPKLAPPLQTAPVAQSLTRTQMISQGELIFEDTAPHVWYCNADSAKSCCCTCGKVRFARVCASVRIHSESHPLFGSCWRFRQALFSPVRFNPAAARFARRRAHRLLQSTFSFAAQAYTCLHSRHTYRH